MKHNSAPLITDLQTTNTSCEDKCFRLQHREYCEVTGATRNVCQLAWTPQPAFCETRDPFETLNHLFLHVYFLILESCYFGEEHHVGQNTCGSYDWGSQVWLQAHHLRGLNHTTYTNNTRSNPDLEFYQILHGIYAVVCFGVLLMFNH